MNRILKYIAAAALAGALAAATSMPSQAHEWHHGGTAAAIGLGAGALIGAAAANSAYYGDPYYADYDYNGYAYEPAPAYYGDYAYSPGYYPWSRSRNLNHGQGPGCIQSPASYEYTSCD